MKQEQFDAVCKRTISKAHALGTKANHCMHKKSYYRFCDKFQLNPIPANDWQYCQYAQYLAWEDKVPETVENYVRTVRLMHKLKNEYVPAPLQIHFKLLTEGLKKECKKPVKQADSLDHDILKQLFPHVNLEQELQVVTWVAVLVGFNLVLRVSNLGPRARKDFNKNMHLV